MLIGMVADGRPGLHPIHGLALSAAAVAAASVAAASVAGAACGARGSAALPADDRAPSGRTAPDAGPPAPPPDRDGAPPDRGGAEDAGVLRVTTSCDLPFEPPPLWRVGPGPEFLFDPENLPLFEIEMSGSEWALLCANAAETAADGFERDPYAPALWSSARVRVAERTLQQVAVRLKGRSSLLNAFAGYDECLRALERPGEGFSRKPSFKLRFNRYAPGRLLHDVARLSLSGEEGSRAYLEEIVFAGLAADLGLLHRRANHALLCINDRYHGVYTIEEEADDRPFLRHHLPDPDADVYKDDGAISSQTYPSDNPERYREAYIPVAGTSDLGEDPLAFVDLMDLLRWGNFASDQEFALQAPERLDIDQWLGVTALELVLGDWDGMLPRKSNYLLVHLAGERRWTVVRYDTDLTGLLDVAGWTPSEAPLLWCPRADALGDPNLPNGQAPLLAPGRTAWTTRRAVIAARLLYVLSPAYLEWADRAASAAEVVLDTVLDERGARVADWFHPHDPWSSWPGPAADYLAGLRRQVAAARDQLDALGPLEGPVPCPPDP